jgi:hypothetical protein
LSFISKEICTQSAGAPVHIWKVRVNHSHTKLMMNNREGSKKKICDTNPLVVVVKKGENWEISNKV